MHTEKVRKTEENIPLGRQRHRWEESINMTFKKIQCEDMQWINLAQDSIQRWALVNALINFGYHKRQGISKILE
jgi:hypothetical protein